MILKMRSSSIPAGSSCAVVGPSGSSKSMLLRRLMRMYNVTSGQISMDSVSPQQPLCWTLLERPLLQAVCCCVHVCACLTSAVARSESKCRQTWLESCHQLSQLLDWTLARVAGVNVRDLRQASLRSCVAVVPQDTVLFNDTVINNVAYGRPGASRMEILEAASAPCVLHLARRCAAW